MTREHDLDRALESWMQEGPEALPDRVLTDALVQVDRTPQRRFPELVGPNRLWLVAAAILALAVVAQVVWLGPPRIGPPSPGGSLEPSAVIEVQAALAVAAADGEVWVTSEEALVRIDPATGETTAFPIPVRAGDWAGLAIAGDTIWTGSFFGGTVYRIDRRTGEIEAEIDTLSSTVSITAVPGGVWVAVAANRAQFIADGATTAGEPVPAGTTLSYGYGSLWIGNTGEDEIVRADPLTGQTEAVITVPPQNSCGATPAAGAVWSVGCFGTSTTMTRIDPATNEVVATIETGVWPGVAEIDGSAWVLGSMDRRAKLQRIDLASNTIDRSLRIGPDFDPDNAVVSGDSIWVANDSQDEVWRFELSDIRAP